VVSTARTTAWTQDDSRDGGGRECWEHILEIERRRNAYTDVGGRKRQEQVFEPKPRTAVYMQIHEDSMPLGHSVPSGYLSTELTKQLEKKCIFRGAL